MYCKLFINCDDRKKLLALLKQRFGSCTDKRNDHFFSNFDIHLVQNKDQLPDNLTDIADRFLYYPTIADLDIYSDYIEITNEILRIIRNENIHAVAACDYEDELTCKGE